MPRSSSVEVSSRVRQPRVCFGPAVLLVADDPVTSFSASHALQAAGYEVKFIRLGRLGSSAPGRDLIRDPVELVVIDASRRSRDALTLLEGLRSADSALPVVVIAGAATGIREEASSLGAEMVIESPLDAARLRAAAEALVPVLREFDVDEARGYSFH